MPQFLQKLIKSTKDFLKNESENHWGIYENDSVRVILNINNILVLQFKNISYYGGIHGQTYLYFKCFKLNQQEQLELSDLFHANFEDELTRIAKDEFYNMKGLAQDADLDKENFWFKENTFHLNNNFYIHTDGLHFFYNNYDIASYGSGPTDLIIPWLKIAHLLKPEI